MEHIFTSTRDAVVVQTKQGKLRGFYYDDVFNFWGVRYARARRCLSHLNLGKAFVQLWLTDMSARCWRIRFLTLS